MAHNWNAFLADEGRNPPDGWSDTQRIPAGPPANMATSSSTSPPQTLSLAQDNINFGLYEPSHPAAPDSYFSDAYFGLDDYFLGELGVLEPFGNTIAGASTSDSSPEPSTGVSVAAAGTLSQNDSPNRLSNSVTPDRVLSMSPTTTHLPSRPMQDTEMFSNSNFPLQFPPRADTSVVEDLTFPDGPSGAAKTTTTAMDSTTIGGESNTNMKRQRAAGRLDTLSACWTSPLCPNHGADGPPPNPATCGGGCAPFLFATEDPLPTSAVDQLLPHETPIEEPEGVVEIRRRLKRSESDSSAQPSGRTFSKSGSKSSQTVVKEESSGESPEQAPPIGDDVSGKVRRRLPHNQVERKYRESLNTQLESLRKVVPSLQQSPRNCDSADIEDLPTPSKPSKAVILASATAYIKQMEKEKKQMHDEITQLRSRVKALQSLVKCQDCSLMQYVVDLKINNQN